MMRYRSHVVGLGALLITALSINACGPGTPPAGQPAMVVLTAQTLEMVRQEFNRAADQTRVVLLLSPT